MRKLKLITSTGKSEDLDIEVRPEESGYFSIMRRVRELCLEDPAVEWVAIKEAPDHECKVFRGFALGTSEEKP